MGAGGLRNVECPCDVLQVVTLNVRWCYCKGMRFCLSPATSVLNCTLRGYMLTGTPRGDLGLRGLPGGPHILHVFFRGPQAGNYSEVSHHLRPQEHVASPAGVCGVCLFPLRDARSGSCLQVPVGLARGFRGHASFHSTRLSRYCSF